MKKDRSLMEFPSDFQIKIIGTNSESFIGEVFSVARKHFPLTEETSIRSQLSQKGNYLAITLTIYVSDQMTLDRLYLELTNHPNVKWVL